MQLFHFDSLQKIPSLRHAITTREMKSKSGASGLEYSRLNLAFHVGDDEKLVRENRRALALALNFDADSLVAAQQVHGAHSQIVALEYSRRGAMDLDSAILETDALITREKQIPLLILVADCAPILIVDPTRKVLAVVHAGWRGALAGIASRVVAEMELEFNSNAREILCGIGPCLCAACLEIGDEVACQMPPDCIIGGFEKPHLDLRALIERDLTRSGVLQAHIETMANCPRCENEIFFSHRAQNGKAGRFGLVAWWE